MQRRSLLRFWPLLVVALVSGCTDETTPSNTAGSGGAGGASGAAGTGGTGGASGGSGGSGGTAGKDSGVAGDGGLSPCALDLPTVLDRPPSGALPCDLLPPGFVAP